MKTSERTIAVALIFSADGKILQGQRNPKTGGVYNDGSWHIPGGGIEKGEKTENALVREVKEETGLDISDLPHELIDDTGEGESIWTMTTGEEMKTKMKFYTYKIILPTKAANTHIEMNDDLGNYRWTDPKDLKTIKLTPPSVELFTKLGYLK